MKHYVPTGFKLWPAHDVPAEYDADEIPRMYAQGYAGVLYCPEAAEKFRDEVLRAPGASATIREAAAANGWEDSHAGKLVVPFLHVEKRWPGSMPGPAQRRGDCVSHSTKNACLLTLTCEVAAGRPDEVTGKVEDLPDVPEQGIRQGVLSTEAIYWWRRHGGDGWYCQDAARVVCKESGTPWPRKAYPEFDLDLTNYSAQLAGKWGSTPPPSTIRDFGMKHAIRTAAECDSFEEIRDALGNGYGVSSCGSEGFSSRRNEDGVSSRSGSWAHAMAYIGADDRDETKRKYGGPLVLVLNSWAVWNNGPRRILGTQTDIPEGSFWARWSDVKRRYAVAFSGVNGWPRKRLPDLLGLNYG